MRFETSRTDYLADSTFRYNSSCNAIELGIECDSVCRDEAVECVTNCGRNSSDPVVIECKYKCYNDNFGCLNGELTILTDKKNNRSVKFDKYYLDCPCYKNCPLGCPCPTYPGCPTVAGNNILVLNSYNGNLPVMLENLSGEF